LAIGLAPARILAAPFTDGAGSTGTGVATNDRGVAWGDYNNDGYVDLYMSKDNNLHRLFQNLDGSGFFDFGGSGTNGPSAGRGVAWGDYDNDGYLDLYLANEGTANRLYRNNGNGQTFTESGGTSGTADTGNSKGIAWGDYDADGYLDLYVANYGSANRLYHNNQNGTFTDVGGPSGTADTGNSNGVAWGDYDNDGDLDLYVANDNLTAVNKLYRNNGNGTFTNVATASGTNDSGSNMGVAWGDYDNDGDLDLYMTKYGTANRLFRNNGNGTFSDVAAASGTADAGNGTGVAWADYDHDGDLDLYVVNEGSANRHYRNNGNGTFSDVGAAMGTNDGGNGQAVAWADYDLDGDLDLYLANNGPNRLYRNDSAVPPGQHWLHVNLVGSVSNHSGIGARVRCVAGGITAIREISGGSGYLSQCSLTAEFGLGTAATVDSLEVRWPSGVVQTITNSGVDQRITVTEPAQFTEVGAASGTDGDLAHGIAWGDYDSDGDLDLYVTELALENRLYRNNSNGTFTDVAAASGTVGIGESTAAIWGDYDNDGDLDLYVASRFGPNQLYRNNGDGTFIDVGAASGTNGSSHARGAAWGDYDRDGYLDLYVVNDDAPNRLYHNLGNGTFAEVGAASGTNNFNDGTGAAWGDYDSDGDLDLYIGNLSQPNVLYRNNGNGTFTNVATATGTAYTGQTHGVAWGDYDNDGDLDLYLASMGEPNRLYRNNGNGTFAEVGAASGTNDSGLSRGVTWGDFDNDGFLDLYVANDGVSNLYKNGGSGAFTKVTAAYGVGGSGLGVGVAWADYDQDGDLDLYAAVFDQPSRLYRNDNISLVANHWFGVNLIGTGSNRAGIGARVRCVSGNKRMMREISSGSGYLSQEPLTARFGLGLNAVVDTLEVRWPSGIVQTLVNLGVDQQITLTEPPPFRFTEVGAASGTNNIGLSYGAAWGDYDSDGDLDLYISNFAQSSANLLYRNNGNGTFTNVAVASGTTGNGNSSTGVAWGDYDNDGDLDLYVGSYGANQLYRNNGNGTFTDVGAASGTNDAAATRGVAWGDYDRNGYLDLYVSNDGPNRLYRNNGNGTFTDVGAASGTNDGGGGAGAAWGDYDSDGDLDLYTANYAGATRHYRNNGNGTFTDVAASSGTNYNGPGVGVAWGDYDSDGDLDLYLATYGDTNRLYKNNGNGTFTEVGAASGTNDGGLGRGPAWGDYDNNGYLDLYVTNESEDRLYQNQGNGAFASVGRAYGTNDMGLGVGVAWGDYDSDGDLDLYVTGYGSANRLYRNDGAIPPSTNHWLWVDLVGTQSNRSGIGARVRCVAGTLNAIREISGGSGFLSQNSLTAAFGLGTAASVDTLEIRWPSGIVQVVPNPGVNHRITVTEAHTDAVPEAALVPAQYALHTNVPNPFNPSTAIRFDLPSSGAVHLTVFDVAGRPVRRLLADSDQPAGQHQVTWDGRDDQGTLVASGIYFYQIAANDFRATRRMTLLK
jgi:hypothetical protein